MSDEGITKVSQLETCARRVVYRTPDDEVKQIFCKPSFVKLQKLAPSSIRKQTALFAIREVNLSICQRCSEIEKVSPQPLSLKQSFNAPDDPTPFELQNDPRTALIEAEKQKQRQKSLRKPRLLIDGTVVYNKLDGDWEPPPLLPGYRRKSNDPASLDAWILVPKRKMCQYMEFEQYRPPTCDCFRVRLLCVRENPPIVLQYRNSCEICQHYIVKEETQP